MASWAPRAVTLARVAVAVIVPMRAVPEMAAVAMAAATAVVVKVAPEMAAGEPEMVVEEMAVALAMVADTVVAMAVVAAEPIGPVAPGAAGQSTAPWLRVLFRPKTVEGPTGSFPHCAA